MCLAIPAQITELHGNNRATVEIGGVKRAISVALVDDVVVGDFVIVHVGHALQKLSQEDAMETLAIIDATIECMQQAMDEDNA